MRFPLCLVILVAVAGCQAPAGMERVSYGLGDEQSGHGEELVQLVKREVPEQWNAKGSAHRIKAYDRGRMLDIQTTPENLEKITRLMSDDELARQTAE